MSQMSQNFQKDYKFAIGSVDSHDTIRSSLPEVDLSPTETASEYLWSKVTSAPEDRTFLIQGQTGSEITYGQAKKNILHLANWLVSKNVQSDDVVMLYCDNNIEAVTAMLSTVILAIPYFGVSPMAQTYDLRAQILGLKSSVIFMNSSKIDTFKQTIQDPEVANFLKDQLKAIVILDDEFENTITEFENFRFADILKQNVADRVSKVPHFPVVDKETHPYFIAFTSGSTGKPKPIVHTQRSVYACFRLSPWESLRGACNKPLCHVGGNMFISMFILEQQTLLLFNPCEVEVILSKVEQYQIEVIFAASNYIWKLAKEDYNQKYNLRHLKIIKYLGSIMPRHLIETIDRKYAAKILNFYGSSEFLFPVTVDGMIDAGTPIQNTEIKILDITSGVQLGPGKVGELLIRSPSCLWRYHNNDKATKESFDSQGYFHTGDVGYFDSNGRLTIVDRIKEMIKYRDCGVSPVEIENCIQELPGVLGVCVVGVPHIVDNAHARAYVQVVPGSKLSADDVVEHVKKSLSYLKHLYGGVRFVDEIPTISIGKMDRNYFKRLCQNENEGA